MENKFNTPWSPVCDKARFGYMLNCNGNRLDLEHSQLLNHVAQCVNACVGMDDPMLEVQRLKNKAAAAMLEPVVSEKVEFLYTSSTETLKNSVDWARAGDFTSIMHHVNYSAEQPAKELNVFFGADNFVIKDCSGNIVFDSENPDSFFNNYSEFLKRKPWHETGEFPPVGTECEINEPGKSYHGRKVYVFAHYNGRAFAWDEIEESAYHSDNPSEFRPIQTEKQKIIKEMLWCFDGFFNGDGDNAGQVCEKIYDQFIANKKEK